MGWLYMQSLGGFAGPRQYLDDQCTYAREGRRVRVLRSALVAMRTYYAAVEIVAAFGARTVTAIICLVDYNPHRRDGYIFGYKDIDESVCPCEADCPVPILDLLTPTDRPHALDWRARCRASTARRVAKPTLRDGQIVRFGQPIAFADGTRHERLRVVIDPRRPRAIRFGAPDGSGLYRIGGLAWLDYRVEEVPA